MKIGTYNCKWVNWKKVAFVEKKNGNDFQDIALSQISFFVLCSFLLNVCLIILNTFFHQIGSCKIDRF